MSLGSPMDLLRLVRPLHLGCAAVLLALRLSLRRRRGALRGKNILAPWLPDSDTETAKHGTGWWRIQKRSIRQRSFIAFRWNDAWMIYEWCMYHIVSSCITFEEIQSLDESDLQSSEITGASHGIGRALALQAAQLGAAELILVGSIDDVFVWHITFIIIYIIHIIDWHFF